MIATWSLGSIPFARDSSGRKIDAISSSRGLILLTRAPKVPLKNDNRP